MEQSVRLLLSLLIVLLAGACASAPTTAHATSETSVREAMNGFLEALNALDVERMSAFFADDITAFVPTAKAERVDGKPAVVEVFRQFVEATRKSTSRLEIVPENLEVDANGDIGIVTFNVRSAGSVLRRTFVFRHQGGRWLIVHFHASNFKPPTP
jgi:ketosteroid isomerase-like protein